MVSHHVGLGVGGRSAWMDLACPCDGARCWPLCWLLGSRCEAFRGMRAQVRSKALIQYTAPFVSVNLSTMATAFGTDLGCAPAPAPSNALSQC